MAPIIRRLVSPRTVFAGSMLVTAIATWASIATARGRLQARFDSSVQSTHDRIESRLETYVALLQATAAFVGADGHVTRSEFRAYAERLQLRERYPGIQGVGLTWRTDASDLPALEARLRAEGDTGFQVWPDIPREEYHAIVHLEPLDRRNMAAIGYDMYTEPVRREAMARARDSGGAVASGRVQLVQEIDERKQNGFLIYAPAYRGGRVPDDVESRRASLMGFVYAPFRSDDLFLGIFGREREPRVAFRIYDGEETDSGSLLYDSRVSADQPELPPQSSLFGPETTVRIENAGRIWTLQFTATPALTAYAGGGLVPLVALAGILVTIALTMLARAQVRDRRKLERGALELEALAMELRKRNDELAAANRAKSEFLAMMSHEIRTPINAIIGYTQLLDVGVSGPTTPGQREQLTRIMASGRHLLALIDDILDLSQIEAGRLSVPRGNGVAGETADAALALVRPQALAKRITVSDLCEGDRDVLYTGDDRRVQQILVNLLANAVKFTPSGGKVALRCRLAELAPFETSTDRGGRWVAFDVDDTGIGIRPEVQQQIFRPFVQGDTGYNRPHGGTGLGLTISQQLARLMGGDLTLESEEGEGSRFTLWLPAEARARSSPDDGFPDVVDGDDETTGMRVGHGER
jgi:two-component system, OmpR family, sensor kinase